MPEKAHRHPVAPQPAERSRRRQLLVITLTAVVSVLVVVGAAALIATNSGDDATPAADRAADSSQSSDPNKPASIPTELAPAPKRPEPLPAQVNCTYRPSAEPASKKNTPPANGATRSSGTTGVTLSTSVGELRLKLDSALAPCAVKSFLSLAGQKYFDRTSCHRMTVGEGLQVLQCGDPSGGGGGGPGYSFADEVFGELRYGRGILAMANSGPGTNGSQFFVVYGGAAGLTPDYTAFGTIDEAGLQAIDEVARAGVVPAGDPGDGRPVVAVDIRTATAVN